MSDKFTKFFIKFGLFGIFIPSFILLLFSPPQSHVSNDRTATYQYDRGVNSPSAYEQPTLPTWEIPEFPTLEVPDYSGNYYTKPSSSTVQSLEFEYWPSTVSRNEDVSVRIRGKPHTRYTITVMYSSGPSSADGLEAKYSNADGYVTWHWHVGGKTNPGTFTITVSGGGESKTVKFRVIV